MARVVVQKFGGTCLASRGDRQKAVARVEDALRSGLQPVVVVSAMGRQGDPYATDTLLSLLPADGHVSPRDLDLLLACGEILSAVVFVAELHAAHLVGSALTGAQAGIVTDGRHTMARIVRVDPARVVALLQVNHIPVVCGFQGATEEGEITTLGRGGSDTSAVALAAALGAEAVEIYKDVDGVKTADPRLVPQARTIPRLDYDETFELARQGAKVIHPRAVEIARQAGLRVQVRPLHGEAAGTWIGPGTAQDLWPGRRVDRAVVGVTQRQGCVQVRVPDGRNVSDQHVFAALADAGISVDLIHVFPDFRSFLVSQEQAADAVNILTGLGLDPQVRPRVAKVTVVGSAIHELPGVMAHVARALAEAEVPILATSDSHQSISCLVPEEMLPVAVQALHGAFHLGESEMREEGR